MISCLCVRAHACVCGIYAGMFAGSLGSSYHLLGIKLAQAHAKDAASVHFNSTLRAVGSCHRLSLFGASTYQTTLLHVLRLCHTESCGLAPGPRCCCSAHQCLQDRTLRTQKVCQVSAYFSRLNRSGAPAWSVRSKMPSASSSCLIAATLRAFRTATIR